MSARARTFTFRDEYSGRSLDTLFVSRENISTQSLSATSSLFSIKHFNTHWTLDTKSVSRLRSLGKTKIKIGNVTLPIFDRERTIVDAFRYLGRETALKALKIALTKKDREKIDIEKIRLYAKKLRIKIEPFLIAMTL